MAKMFSLISLMLLSHSIFATSTFVPSSDDDDVASKPKSIFILAGQSNMAGRGGLVDKTFDRIIPTESQSNPKILRLNEKNSWEQAREPLHDKIDPKPCGVGPGMAFANSVLKQDPSIGVIGLVPCAVGGTSLSQWATGGDLYNNTLNRTRAALRAGGGQIRGILWYQGESDCEKEEDAKTYKDRWEAMFTQLRLDLGSPYIPVVHVIIETSDKGGEHLDTVRESQRQINLPNVKYVDARYWNFELGGDKVHLSTRGEVQLGLKLAEAFLQFHGTPSS